MKTIFKKLICFLLGHTIVTRILKRDDGRFYPLDSYCERCKIETDLWGRSIRSNT